VATRRGRADVRGPTPLRRFVIDYLPAAKIAHASRAHLPQAKVSASAGDVKDIVVADNSLIGGYRLTFVFDPRAAKAAELRAELTFSGRQTAETWVYRWTAP
jgi:glucans biosynthesis protein